LSVVPIDVPALRERREDIRELTNYFLDDFCFRNNFHRKEINDDVLAVLENYAWPGNARELRNAVERMAILSPEGRISTSAIPLEIRLAPGSEARSNLHQTRDTAERESILKALEQTGWNVSGAARVLGVERTNLHKRIRALGIGKNGT
jgi:two-component system nitrogen regulation response regulator NtrX